MSLDVHRVGPHDCLYVSARDDEALVSCAARMSSERQRGLSVLVVSLFQAQGFKGSASALALDLGVSSTSLGLVPDAARPGGGGASSFRLEIGPGDDAVLAQATQILDDLRPRVRARHVYLPLGVGGRLDHRIAYQAGLAGLAVDPGRNVFLYEDRPEAFVPGAVRVRLGLLGARLPAGAVRSADPGGLLSHLARAHQPRALRGEALGPAERLALLRRAARERRDSKAWNAQRAFGPRLQPVVHSADPAGAAFARKAWEAVVTRAGAQSRVHAQAAAYSRLLGPGEHSERYWLLLPQLESARLGAVAEEGL
jgi:hypothetical protein